MKYKEDAMEKGRFGIRLSFYTVLAFILAFLGYSTLLFLLAGIVIFVEKDEWAGKQVIQAICLCLIVNLVSSVLGILDPIRYIPVPVLSTMWNAMKGLITSILSIAVLAMAVVGILNNLKGKDANILGASKLAGWAYAVMNRNNETN